MVELTLNEVKRNLFDRAMLHLLVGDYETGMAYAEDSEPSASRSYFKQPVEIRARQIAEHIQNITKFELEKQIEEILVGRSN